MPVRKRLTACAFAALAVALLALARPARAEQGPEDVVTAFHAALLESMRKGEQLGFQGRCRVIEPAFKSCFAVRLIAEKSMGRYWKDLREGEKNLLEEKYAAWSIAQYAHNFDSYEGEQFQIASRNEQGDSAAVADRLVSPGGKEVTFDYRLHKIEGRWRIIDIQIEGVSQLAQTRSQFTYIMGEKGFLVLIDTLQSKTEALSTK